MNTSLSTIAESRDPLLKGLVCAYTGKPLTMRVSVSPRLGVLYFAVNDGSSPSGRQYDDLPSLMLALRQRNGVGAAVDEKEAAKCPYTGVALSIVQRGSRWMAKGGFNPFAPNRDPREYARLAKMRGGVGPAVAPAPRVSVAEVVEPELPEEGLKEKYAEQAEKLTEQYVKSETSPVTVAAPGPVKKAPYKPTKKRRGT